MEETGEKVIEKELGLSRIGVSLPGNLLNKFDSIIRKRGYTSRSEGIRDAMRDYIVEYEWMKHKAGEKIGTIAYLCDTRQKGLRSELEKIESDFRDIIKISDRLYLGNGNCFAIVVTKDNVEQIKALTEAIMSQKGVKHVKLTTTHQGI